ncbi:interferon-induced protein 44 [Carassius auratus]|uniref:Interferon-induced protein 44-like n=1 Tax=Carassius auratus TaxID=7957 RepID=A0A6P6K0A9_CARAU|nr:interferon-induced protein 44-like [Carassius auratus]XP_026064658.1 interferon-induced protein 44-like [Carassius auratus]
MWLFGGSKQTTPPPSPEFRRPWRSLDWNKDKQSLLKAINGFKPRTSEVGTLKILLYGPQGAGKSSFFNSVDSALKGRITTRALAHAVETGHSFTVECKTYKVRKDSPDSYFPFNFTDIAGMHEEDTGIHRDDIIKLLNGHISSGYTFNPFKPITKEDPNYNKNPTLKDRIHCLVAVLPANTVSLMDETNLPIIRQMIDVRKEARDLGIPQVIIMTKVDELCPLVKDDIRKIYTSKNIKQKMELCSLKLGTPVSCIYPVKNYHEERTIDDTIDILILDALKNIIIFADDNVQDQVDK